MGICLSLGDPPLWKARTATNFDKDKQPTGAKHAYVVRVTVGTIELESSEPHNGADASEPLLADIFATIIAIILKEVPSDTTTLVTGALSVITRLVTWRWRLLVLACGGNSHMVRGVPGF